MCTSFPGHFGVLAFVDAFFGGWGWCHKLQDGRAGVDLVLALEHFGHFGLGNGDLLLLGVVVEGAHELDLLSFAFGGSRLGYSLQQMQGLAVLSTAGI